MTVPATLDHLLWAVPDLRAGVAELASLTGVEPVPGGAHPGLGTANYLVGLRGTAGPAYLEVIGPDPEQDLPADEVSLGVGHVRRSSLHTWAVRRSESTRLNSSHVANSYAVLCLKENRDCR